MALYNCAILTIGAGHSFQLEMIDLSETPAMQRGS
jgi:hypothetical protein